MPRRHFRNVVRGVTLLGMTMLLRAAADTSMPLTSGASFTPAQIAARPHRVVVIGAGFAGLSAVRALAKAPVDIVLVDRRNYHLFQPLLYQVATAGLSPADIASPIRSIVAGQRNVTVLLGKVVGV